MSAIANDEQVLCSLRWVTPRCIKTECWSKPIQTSNSKPDIDFEFELAKCRVLAYAATQHKIRLTGIDAPEKRQAFGNVSKQSLVELVAGQPVAVSEVKVDQTGTCRRIRIPWVWWPSI